MKKVSVILPVYNVEKYIDQCLESIVNQTYKNIEIILVNDGSTDNSYGKILEWSKKDSRIIVLNQKNSGSGIARNNGLSVASGDYVIFVDPDDWIDLDAINDWISAIEKFDVDFLSTGCIYEYFDQNGLFKKQDKDNFKNEVIKNPYEIHKRYLSLLLEGGVNGPAKKVYRMSIIKNNKVEFPDFKRSQDIVFNYRYYSKIKSMAIYNSNHYHYRVILSSYKKKIHDNYYRDLCYMYNDMKKLFKEWNIELSGIEKENFIKYYYELIVWQISLGKSSRKMKDIVNNKDVQEIFKNAKPIGLKQKVLSFLIIRKKYRLINFIIKLLKLCK